MKENKGKVFLIVAVVLIILGLQPGIRENVVHYFTQKDIWSQLGFEKNQKNNVDETLSTE